jgi:hypothetical protein
MILKSSASKKHFNVEVHKYFKFEKNIPSSKICSMIEKCSSSKKISQATFKNILPS